VWTSELLVVQCGGIKVKYLGVQWFDRKLICFLKLYNRGKTTIITKQFSCLKPSLWTTTFVDNWTRLIHYTFIGQDLLPYLGSLQSAVVTRWSHTSRIRAILSIQLKLFKVIYRQLASYFGQITHLGRIFLHQL
jgi:hypothetical protein